MPLLPFFGAVALVGLAIAAWAYFDGQWGGGERLTDEEGSRRNQRLDRSWRRGEDLRQYPRRLKELEDQLIGSHRAAQQQLQHLGLKASEMDEKGRGDLAERYQADLDVLERRAAATRRVMATVWKTRAILHLRVHLAVAARQRPDLAHLPQPLDVDPSELEAAAENYFLSKNEVRTFVEVLDGLCGHVSEIVPPKPLSAEVDPKDELTVQKEVDAIERTLEQLRERMDKLGDTLDYLSDRFKTQRVVEGADLSVDFGPEASKLLVEVSGAVSQLEALSAVGDKGLADAAVDSLCEDIGRLEQAGMEASAEEEANQEVQRLLEQFAR
ncbi:MAG TPA: hypothetical protein QGF58_02690 [Myxococcota bacterium]|nr:hypothetical protein [Myxococcota bacterium]